MSAPEPQAEREEARQVQRMVRRCGFWKLAVRFIPASLVQALSGHRDSEWRILVVSLVFAALSVVLAVWSVADLGFRIGVSARARSLADRVQQLESSAKSARQEKTPGREEPRERPLIQKIEPTVGAQHGASRPVLTTPDDVPVQPAP